MTSHPASTHEIGIALQGNKSAADYVRIGQLAEDFAFAAVSVYGDLMFQPPLYPLLILAEHTSTVRLGPCCLNPYMLHPVEIAGQIAALDALSDGRAFLGIAPGAWLRSVGVRQERPLARIRDAIEVVRRLLAGNTASYGGETVEIEHHVALEYEVRRPTVPVLIGGWGPKIIQLAGELAQEVKIGGSSNPAMVTRARLHIGTGATRVNRHPDDVAVVVGAVTVIDEDREAARHLARQEVARYLPIVAPRDPTIVVDPERLDRVADLVRRDCFSDAARLIDDQILDRFAFAGSPHQVIEMAEALFAAGANRIDFGTPHGLNGVTGIRLLGERIVPHFRQ